MLSRYFIFIAIAVGLAIISYFFVFSHEDKTCSDFSANGFGSKDECIFRATMDAYEKYKSAGKYDKINFTFCDELEDAGLKDACFNYTAGLQFLKPYKMPLCARIINNSIRDSCYSKVCYQFDDADCCDESSNEEQKNACIELVAVKLKNTKLCKSTGSLQFECCSKILCPEGGDECSELCRN